MPNPPTPNMGLIAPTVNGDFDEWGTELNTAINAIDAQAYSQNNPVTPLGMDINRDLSLQGNNLNQVRAVRMNNQTAAEAGPGDVLSIYPISGDLWYNNAAGVPVRLTNGTSIASNATASTIFPQTSASSSFTILSSASYIQVLVNTSTVPCTVNLPSASAVGAGRYFIITDVSNNAATNNITISPNGSDTINKTSSVIFSWNNESAFFTPDSSANWNLTGDFKTALVAAETFTNAGIINNNGTINNNHTLANGDSSTTSFTGGSQITGSPRDYATRLLYGTITTTGADGYVYAGTANSIQAQVATGIVSGVVGGLALTGGSSDWTTFGGTPRSRTIQSAIVPVSLPNVGSDATWNMNSYEAGYLNSTMGAVYQTGVTFAANENMVFNIPMHNGATLASITISFIVSSRSGNAPANFPSLAIARNTFPNGSALNTVQYLSSTSFQPLSTAANGTIWYASGNIQQFTYTCTQNNVIDTSTYTYAGVLYGENGTHSQAGDAFYNITVSYTGINDMQFP